MTTVSSRYFNSAIDACVQAGVPREEIADSFPLAQEEIDDPTARISAAKFLELLHFAERYLGEQGVGLEVGKSFRPQTFLDIGYGAIHCENIVDALNFNQKYQRLTQEVGTTKIILEGDTASIIWRPASDDDEYMRPMTDAVFGGYCTMGQWMSWVDMSTIPSVLELRHDTVAYADVFADTLKCDVRFNAPRNALNVPTKVALTPFPQRNPELVRIIASRLDRLLLSLDRGPSMTQKASHILQALLADGDMSSAKLAKLMCTSERTLRRRLKEEGTSYRKLLQDVRKDNCEVHLCDPSVSLTELSQRLGYAEQSSFNSAFIEWFGTTPSKFRERYETREYIQV